MNRGTSSPLESEARQVYMCTVPYADNEHMRTPVLLSYGITCTVLASVNTFEHVFVEVGVPLLNT